MYGIYERVVKRILDVMLASIVMFITAPIFLLIVIRIKTDSRGPVFFSQKRVGVNGSYFNIIKFRTMRVDTPKECPTHLLEQPEKYITKIGNFLRKTSLDELPQLINILIGDMSFVGPRPALWNQEDLIKEREKYRANAVKPGLTGWAQVNGRDELPIPVKARLDGEYIKRIGFWFDVDCLIRTVLVVATSEGNRER